jgi:hypothetical protein
MPEQPVTVRMHFKFDGGSATDGMLDIYDASIAMRGMSRSLNILTHAFLNEGQVRHRGDHAKGARIFVHPPTRGSYDQLVSIVLSVQALGDLTVGVAGAALWDVTKWAYAKVVGKDEPPSTPAGRRRVERIEPTFGELNDALQPAVRELHRPIQDDPEIELDLIRPRVGKILTFDRETLGYIAQTIQADDDILISGNITRYNILSGYGRLYDDKAGQTVAFEAIRGLSPAKRNLLTRSLDQSQRRDGGKLLLTVSASRDSRGELVKYVVKDVRRGILADAANN